MSPSTSSSDVRRTLRAGRIGVSRLVGLAGVVVTPLTVAIAIVPLAYFQTGVVALPAVFPAVALILAMFIPGYLDMSRTFAKPGGFYSFVAHGLHPAAGVGAALIALLAYGALLVGLFGVIGDAVWPLLPTVWQLHWAVPALAALALVLLAAVAGIKVPSAIALIALVLDVVWVGFTGVTLLLAPAESTTLASTAAQAFAPDAAVAALLTSAATALATLGYVGLETTAVHRRNARDARTVPRATVITLAVLTGMYVLTSLALVVAVGPGRIGAAAAEHGPRLVFVLAEQQLGTEWVALGQALFAFSVVAAMIGFFLAVSLYIHTLAGDGVLPRRLARLSGRTHSPVTATLLSAALTALVVVVAASLDWHPVEHLFLGGGAVGALGVLILMTMTAVAAVRHQHHARATTGRRALSLLGALGLGFLLTLTLWHFDALLGPPILFLRWAAPAAMLGLGLGGAAYALRLRTRRPAVYAAIFIPRPDNTDSDNTDSDNSVSGTNDRPGSDPAAAHR